ncbi:hypothetical protein MDA_GLEAN10013364 [Myotis davidii]|uniref:Uncharacterized protein n=1 Tax=Myotis davidii TaxID=225400 RepID=L5M9Y7_MYODS|nr:hypothetical protein MDA_GLEAN10013364 [Myotis davidii]
MSRRPPPPSPPVEEMEDLTIEDSQPDGGDDQDIDKPTTLPGETSRTYKTKLHAWHQKAIRQKGHYSY